MMRNICDVDVALVMFVMFVLPSCRLWAVMQVVVWSPGQDWLLDFLSSPTCHCPALPCLLLLVTGSNKSQLAFTHILSLNN